MTVLKQWCVLLACCLGLCLSAASGWAFSFEAEVDIAKGSVEGVTSLQMADISGDGRADIVCAEGGKGAKGRYTFAWFEAPSTASGIWIRHNINTSINLRPFLGGMRLADMNKDGDIDIVLSSDMHSGSTKKAEVFVFYHPGGNGTGKWEQVRLHDGQLTLHHLNDMEIGDFDRDGRLDVAVRSLSPNQIHLFFQNTKTSWFLRSLDTGIEKSEGMGIGDLDGDGGDDITFTGYWFDFPNKPRTDPIPKRTIDGGYHTINQNTKEFTADIDGDGDIDVVVGPAEKFRNGGSHKLNWYENVNGDASKWKTHTIESNTNDMHTVIGGDMDNDGDIDIITGQPWGTVQVRIFENDGRGNFAAPYLVVKKKGLYTGALGDVDKDGDLDLAGQNGYSGSSKPYLYVNTTNAAGDPPPMPNEAPTAHIDADKDSGDAPLTVNFDGSGSSDPDDSIASYYWDFADGNISAEESPTHTFTEPGTYLVVLTVTDANGAEDSETFTVTVNDANEPPVGDGTKVDDTDARVVWAGSWGIDNNNRYTKGAYNNTLHWAKEVGAKGSLTFEGDWVRVYCKKASNGKILRVSVDGGPHQDVNLVGTGEQQQMVFEAKNLGAGQHTILVEARGKTVHVDYFEFGGAGEPGPDPNEAPTAAIAADTLVGEAPATINFDGTGSFDTDGDIVSFAWAFGDGKTSDEAKPSHVYTAAGEYTVSLTVTDNDGATHSTNESISISSAPEPPPIGESTIVDDNDGVVVWKGTWGLDQEDKWTVGAHNETLHWSTSKGSTGELTFSGTWVKVYCKTATNGGILRVSVDGGAYTDINLNGSGQQQQLIFEVNGLSAGTHTIKVENRSKARTWTSLNSVINDS